MRHGIRLAAQVHDGVRDATGDVHEREVAELAVGAIETRGELSGQLEDEAGTFRSDLPEARIRHFRQLALIAGADPRTAGGLLVEQAHLAEELPTVEVGE